MRVDTIFKFHFPFEYWTLVTDTNGSTSFVKQYDAMGLLLPQGPTAMGLIAKDQMAIGMQVKNIYDRSGTLITAVGGVGYPMYVNEAEPQFDPFSNVVAWRHTLRRRPPREFEEILSNSLTEGLE